MTMIRGMRVSIERKRAVRLLALREDAFKKAVREVDTKAQGKPDICPPSPPNQAA